MKFLILISSILLSFVGCQKEESNSEIWWVNSTQVDCVGVGPMKCLQIQKGENLESDNWQFFYDQIQGFEFEPGFIYQLLVKTTPKEGPIPSDASSLDYKLVKIISKNEDQMSKITGTWKILRVNEIQNPSKANSNELLQFQFDSSEMSYQGDLGCNSARGKIQVLESEKIEFGQAASTKMACMDMTVENAILEGIANTKTYQIEENQLSLLDENGVILILFQSVD